MYCIALYCIPCKRKSSQSACRSQESHWIFCGMQRVIYSAGSILLYFPVITCAQQLCWRPFKDISKSAPILVNSCERFRTVPITFANFPMISEHFRKIKKIIKAHQNCFEPFPKFKVCLRIQKIQVLVAYSTV